MKSDILTNIIICIYLVLSAIFLIICICAVVQLYIESKKEHSYLLED